MTGAHVLDGDVANDGGGGGGGGDGGVLRAIASRSGLLALVRAGERPYGAGAAVVVVVVSVAAGDV